MMTPALMTEESQRKIPEASYSSTDSDDIIDMVVEAATENTHEKCSGSGEHSSCWPLECIMTEPTHQAAPRESILRQGTADYDEDLRKALKLSVKEEHQTQEMQSAESKDLKKAMELSLLEMSRAEPLDNDRQTEVAVMSDDEKKQLEIAIMARRIRSNARQR